jgi:large subunit ribosomal protein L28
LTKLSVSYAPLSENRFVKLKLTAKGLRIVDKKGIDTVLTEIRARGEKV